MGKRIKQTARKGTSIIKPRSEVGKIVSKGMQMKKIREEKNAYDEEESEGYEEEIPRQHDRRDSMTRLRDDDRIGPIMETRKTKKQKEAERRKIQKDVLSETVTSVPDVIEDARSDGTGIQSGEEAARPDSEVEADVQNEAHDSDFEDLDDKENDELKMEYERIYFEVSQRLDDILKIKSEAKIGKKFWKKLTVEERRSVYYHKDEFVKDYQAKSNNEFITNEWLEKHYKKYLYESQLDRKRYKVAAKIKRRMVKKAEEKIAEKKLTSGFYGVVGQPMITEDNKLKIQYSEEYVDLEAAPPPCLEIIKGFEKLEDYQRVLLYQKIIDLRDGTDIVSEILQEYELDEDVDKLYQNFKKGRNICKHKIQEGEVYGFRALPEQN